jgi:hypothetical protein
MDGGTMSDLVSWLLIMAIPAAGLLVLTIALNRWGSKHDPMPRTKFEFLTPRSHHTPKDEESR